MLSFRKSRNVAIIEPKNMHSEPRKTHIAALRTGRIS